MKHQDKRANIPTEELRDFVADDEKRPATVLYPRDPSLDPQLVWKGKDEQDSKPLEVPAVPIYVQEKIHPQALIENLRETAKADEPEPELTLFDDFNGIEFEELIDFYQHEQNWANRMILGDSLLVMTSLAEKEGLKGKVQMIYMDPPYGIKFGSNWQVSTRKRDVKDTKAEDATRQPEQIKAFRDTWEMGIHSYLPYLRDRLVVCHGLLSETGSIFVQIGDENVHLVRSVLDEVFGSGNFRSLVTYRTSVGLGAETVDNVSNYLLWYSKSDSPKYRPLFTETRPGEAGASRYLTVDLPDGSTRRATKNELADPQSLPLGAHLFRDQGLTSRTGSSTTVFPVEFAGRTYRPSSGGWRTGKEGMQRLMWASRIIQTGNSISFKKYYDDFSALAVTNFWDDVSGGITSRADPKVYVVQTATSIVERCLLMATDPGDLVLDPTCGSGTTAYVAEQWGRRWITIDTSRVALALARTRLTAAKFPYYILADSPEGARKEAELAGVFAEPTACAHDVRKGFVYKQVPHITLKSIANNPDIEEGMSREEIDTAISRHAEAELLYDQPYEDSSRIRVTGPFTVESLSPHRVLSAEAGASAPAAEIASADGDFATMILENLKKAGVQTTHREERLEFDRLEPFAGTWLHATGEYTDASGITRRVAVSLGPEHGTVGSEQIKEAAKEAVKGVGFDILVVLGFAFDAHASETAKEFSGDAGAKTLEFAVAEEAKSYGKLQVLLARMNPDLAMGDELLKKTGAGNLFMVFGEPDVDIDRTDDGKLTVEIKGVDIYDPTTGEVRNSSTDDIACWFIDTNYNGESFFVRHAYFTGADEPYKKLQRALKAEINEEAWATLCSTKSRPFDPPETGKIAIKVINHYGDEVLKVFNVSTATGTV